MSIEDETNSSYESDSVSSEQRDYVIDSILSRARADLNSFYDELLNLRFSLVGEPSKFVTVVRTIRELLSSEKERVGRSTDYIYILNRIGDIRHTVEILLERIDAEKGHLDFVSREVNKFQNPQNSCCILGSDLA